MCITVWTQLFLHKYLVRIENLYAPLKELQEAMASFLDPDDRNIHYYSLDQNIFLNPECSAAENLIGVQEQILLITSREADASGIELPVYDSPHSDL